MRATDFRDGDVVEVSPGHISLRGGSFKPFQGVVDSRGAKDIFKWVYVRRFGDPSHRAGGWHVSQCRRIARPTHHPALPIPDNVVLGEN